MKKEELMQCDFCGENSVFANGVCYNKKCEVYRKEVLYST